MRSKNYKNHYEHQMLEHLKIFFFLLSSQVVNFVSSFSMLQFLSPYFQILLCAQKKKTSQQKKNKQTNKQKQIRTQCSIWLCATICMKTKMKTLTGTGEKCSLHIRWLNDTLCNMLHLFFFNINSNEIAIWSSCN